MQGGGLRMGSMPLLLAVQPAGRGDKTASHNASLGHTMIKNSRKFSLTMRHATGWSARVDANRKACGRCTGMLLRTCAKASAASGFGQVGTFVPSFGYNIRWLHSFAPVVRELRSTLRRRPSRQARSLIPDATSPGTTTIWKKRAFTKS